MCLFGVCCCFSKFQAANNAAAMAEKSAMELTYVEFLEAMCAVATTLDPDPFTPLAPKTQGFIKSKLLRHV